jgi:hypothetical protein
LLLLLLFTACAGGQAASGSGSANESEPAGGSQIASKSPEVATFPPTAGETLTGILGADAVEGGCAYLQAADGTRYEVLYPRGWNMQLSPLRLIDSDGSVHARAGSLVTVRGAPANDMASICQIGPIFSATEVVAP